MRGPVGSALTLAAMVAALTPATASAESALWTLTASPLAVTTGDPTTFQLTATNEDPVAALSSSSEIGCIYLDVPPNFSVNGADVLRSSAGDSWHIDWIMGNRVKVHVNSGGDRLALLDSVTFTVTAIANSPGSLEWDANAYRDHECGGGGALVDLPPVVIVSGTTITPTPAPTPAPTAAPTPTPTPTPTPLLPLPSLPLPSLGLSATPTPTPAPALVRSTPTPTPAGVARPTDDAGPAPSTSAAPSPSPTPDAGAAPAPGTSGGGTPSSATAPAGIVRPDAQLEFDAERLELGLGSVGLLQGATVWAVPAATIAVPGLLIILFVALQAVGAVAWIPAVRRLRGQDEARP